MSVSEVPDPTVALVTEVKPHSVYTDIGQESRYAHGQSKHKGLGLLEHGGAKKKCGQSTREGSRELNTRFKVRVKSTAKTLTEASGAEDISVLRAHPACTRSLAQNSYPIPRVPWVQL